MGIKETIQYYIDIYDGSEERIIENTMRACFCKRETVKKNIDWLIREEYIKTVSYSEMTEQERNFYNSDTCTILRKIKKYDEKEYYEEKSKRNEEIDKLSNKEKFIIFFKKMEREFERTKFFNSKEYTYDIEDNKVTINTSNGDVIIINFADMSSLYYDENMNTISYKINNDYFCIELYYMWAKCYIKHYICH